VTAPRVVFRADASHEIGFGHVARICALIEEVSAAGGEPIALFGGDHEAVTAWTRDRKIEAQVGDWTPYQVWQAVEEAHAHAVVIDGPYLVETLAPKLIERRVRTVVIDDNGGCALGVAAVVNHNFHAPSLSSTYLARQRLLGRRYMMLRKGIRRYTRGSCRPMSAERMRVIVTFGGSDPVGATVRTLLTLPSDRLLELVVIAGPGFRGDEALRDAAAVAVEAGHTVDVRRSPADPGELFVSADAAITSAGGTLGELAYLGCPALAYAIVPDQVAPARQQLQEGMIAGGREWCELDDDTLRAELTAFLADDRGRAEQRQRALSTADSDGARRVVEQAVLV
jgi:UDP-2,4-diacetamido-2,4,6-trideoxy-beta-L-altropyranose hydrolase